LSQLLPTTAFLSLLARLAGASFHTLPDTCVWR
jgi:hypothetical protein